MAGFDHIRQEAGRAVAAVGLGVFMALTFDEGLLPILLVLGLVVMGPCCRTPASELGTPAAAFAVAVLAAAGGYAVSSIEAPAAPLLLGTIFSILLATALHMKALWTTAPLVMLALLLPGLSGIAPALLAIGLEARALARGGRYAPRRDRDRISRTIWAAAVLTITCLADPIFELRGVVPEIACPGEAMVCRSGPVDALLSGDSYLGARDGTMDLALAIIVAQAGFVTRLIDQWIMRQHGKRR